MDNKNLDDIFENALKKFLISKRTNRGGQTYNLFDSRDKSRDLLYLKEVFQELISVR